MNQVKQVKYAKQAKQVNVPNRVADTLCLAENTVRVQILRMGVEETSQQEPISMEWSDWRQVCLNLFQT